MVLILLHGSRTYIYLRSPHSVHNNILDKNYLYKTKSKLTQSTLQCIMQLICFFFTMNVNDRPAHLQQISLLQIIELDLLTCAFENRLIFPTYVQVKLPIILLMLISKTVDGNQQVNKQPTSILLSFFFVIHSKREITQDIFFCNKQFDWFDFFSEFRCKYSVFPIFIRLFHKEYIKFIFITQMFYFAKYFIACLL